LEYKRHGTVTLLPAGIDLLTGQVHALMSEAVGPEVRELSRSMFK
jgi:hypothetical protein